MNRIALERAAWIGRADRLYAEAFRSVRVLAAVTPRNAPQERARLIEAWSSGDEAAPRWSYVRTDHAALIHALEMGVKRLAEEDDTALGRVYADRGRELIVEAKIAEAPGTPELAALAHERYRVDDAWLTAAKEIADKWLTDRPTGQFPVVDKTVSYSSDGAEPESLLNRMREAVGRLHLPFQVMTHPSLASLAATGDRTIYVATGRQVTDQDIRRTVVHEIEAHARPRERASKLALRLFQVGSARGTDEQEGFALVLEERHGFLKWQRRREIAARHRTVLAMLEGATFVDAMRVLLRQYGFAPSEAVPVCERAFRGSHGESPGVGRERVYLPSFLRVRDWLANHPTDEAVLASGQVSVDAIAALSPLATWEAEPLP